MTGIREEGHDQTSPSILTIKISKVELINSNILSWFATGYCTNLDLGMQSGSIPDNRITASSELNISTPAKNGRLNYTAGSSWCASTSDSNPYLQIDLQTLHIICAVSTQGNSQADDWVKTYTLQSSRDGKTWKNYEDGGIVKVSFSIQQNCSQVTSLELRRLIRSQAEKLPLRRHVSPYNG